MKKMFLKIVLFATLIIGINLILDLFLSPFWGRKKARVKLEKFEEVSKEINTVFVGSSIIYRQIIPKYFDSLAALKGYEISSFNMGVSSFPAPQSYKMLEHLIVSNPQIKYYFVELTPVYDAINDAMMNQPENYYWYDAHQLSLMIKHIFAKGNIGYGWKLRYAKDHLQMYLARFFHISIGRFYFSDRLNVDEWTYEEIEKNKGFVAYNNSIRFSNQANQFIERRDKFLKSPGNLDKRRKLADKYNPIKNNIFQSPYPKELERLENLAEENGAKIFFILPPRLPDYERYNHVIEIFEKKNVFNFSKPQEYPEFYLLENSFDEGHMNIKGARILTEKLVDKFLEKINKNRNK